MQTLTLHLVTLGAFEPNLCGLGIGFRSSDEIDRYVESLRSHFEAGIRLPPVSVAFEEAGETWTASIRLAGATQDVRYDFSAVPSEIVDSLVEASRGLKYFFLVPVDLRNGPDSLFEPQQTSIYLSMFKVNGAPNFMNGSGAWPAPNPFKLD